jgi:hypothetical protein
MQHGLKPAMHVQGSGLQLGRQALAVASQRWPSAQVCTTMNAEPWALQRRSTFASHENAFGMQSLV